MTDRYQQALVWAVRMARAGRSIQYHAQMYSVPFTEHIVAKATRYGVTVNCYRTRGET